jgi:hypothetical protein
MSHRAAHILNSPSLARLQCANNKQWRRNFRSTLLLLLVCCLGWSQMFVLASAFTDEEEGAPLDRQYTLFSDWVLMMDVRVLDRFLNYNGSTVHPITQVHVSCFVRDFKTGKWGGKQSYEDLWFHDGIAIGCHRYQELPVRSGSTGIIAIRPTKDGATQTKALDDAMLHLLLDVELINSVVSRVLLPLDICDNASSDLGAFNFYQAKMLTGGAVILLHLQSLPQGFDKYFTLKLPQ